MMFTNVCGEYERALGLHPQLRKAHALRPRVLTSRQLNNRWFCVYGGGVKYPVRLDIIFNFVVRDMGLNKSSFRNFFFQVFKN